METLQEWVSLLQQMVVNLQGMDKSSHKIGDLLYRVNEKQGEQIALLKEQNELMKARLKQYEVAFSAEHFNDVRRLN
jgi:hypothetical protein